MNLMRTLFLNPPSPWGEPKATWYPTWLAQPAAMIANCKLIDAAADRLNLAQLGHMARGFDLCVIHTSTPSFRHDLAVAELLKVEYPRMKIGLIGAHAAALPEDCLNASVTIDFVAREEYDVTLKEVAQGRPYAEIHGLSYRVGRSVQHNKDRAAAPSADTLPSVLDVYRRDLTIENYAIPFLRHPFVSLSVGRGCPAPSYLWPQADGFHYRGRSPQNVLAEAAKALELFPQARELFFHDDTFMGDLARAEEIAAGLGKLKAVWSCHTRPNVPLKSLRLFKDNGLRLLVVRYESGSQAIHDGICSGIRLDLAREFTRQCRELGIAVHGTFALGLPGESRQTLTETTRFACRLDIDSIQVALAAPYPGTEFYKQAITHGWIKKEDVLTGDWQQCYPLRYPGLPSEEIAAAAGRLQKKFYLRPRHFLRLLLSYATDSRARRRGVRRAADALRGVWRKAAARLKNGKRTMIPTQTPRQ